MMKTILWSVLLTYITYLLIPSLPDIPIPSHTQRLVQQPRSPRRSTIIPTLYSNLKYYSLETIIPLLPTKPSRLRPPQPPWFTLSKRGELGVSFEDISHSGMERLVAWAQRTSLWRGAHQSWQGAVSIGAVVVDLVDVVGASTRTSKVSLTLMAVSNTHVATLGFRVFLSHCTLLTLNLLWSLLVATLLTVMLLTARQTDACAHLSGGVKL
jgi:hypothetical protein